MGSMNLPTTRPSSSVHNIAEDFTKKRYREIKNKEDEQEEEYLQARQVKRRTFAELEAELPRLMMNMSLPCGKVQQEKVQDTTAIQIYTSKRKLTNSHEIEEIKRRRTMEHIGKKVEALRITTKEEYDRDFSNLPSDILLLILDKLLEPIDHARYAVVLKEWHSLAKQYNCEKQAWLRVLPPMLLIPTQSHGTDEPATMLYSVSERKFYRNIKLPVPSDDTIYCGFGWMAKLNESRDGRVAITLNNPFRNSKDVIHLPPLPPVNCFLFASPGVKIILPTDPTLDRNNYVVLAIRGSTLFFIRGGQTYWDSMPHGCSTATYHEGRVFSVLSETDTELFVSGRFLIDEFPYNLKRVAFLIHLYCIRYLAQTYLVTSTRGELLIVMRFLAYEKNKQNFRVFRWVESLENIAAVDDIGEEAIFVGSNQSVCVSASKFPGYLQPNSIYYTNDVVMEGQRSEDIGIFNLKDGTVTQLFPQNHFVKGNKVQATWITPAFPGCNS